MNYKLRLIASFITICIFLTACKKVAGDGGLATIQGKVYAIDYDKSGLIKSEGYYGDQRVSLSYGDHTTVDVETRTSPTGEYKFEFLQKGNYTVYVYSTCDTCPLTQRADIKYVTISEKKEVLTVPDLQITQ